MPAAEEAPTPSRAPPSPSSIHRRASIRRTPSVKRTTPAGSTQAGGRRGAHFSAGISTLTSGGDSGVASTPDSSMADPYSVAHASTANFTRSPRQSTLDPANGRRRRALLDFEPDRNPVGQVAHMCDDPDDSTFGGEVFDGRGHGVERVGVERPEAFVEEDRLEWRQPLGREARQTVGQREGQRERGQKRLTARKGTGGSDEVGVAVVDHGEPGRFVERERVRTARKVS